MQQGKLNVGYDPRGKFNIEQSAKNPAENTAGEIASAINTARYIKDIDDVFSGDYPSGKSINIGKTPQILREYGADNNNNNNNNNISMSQTTAYKIAYPEGYMGGKHNLGMSALKHIPEQLSNPVAILKSNTHPNNSIVVLTEWKDGNSDIIIPIRIDKQGAIEIENELSSTYPTKHIQSYLGEKGQNVLYTKNNEDINLLLSRGVQFPKAIAEDILAKNSIPPIKENINSENVGETAAKDFLGLINKAQGISVDNSRAGVQNVNGETYTKGAVNYGRQGQSADRADGRTAAEGGQNVGRYQQTDRQENAAAQADYSEASEGNSSYVQRAQKE